MADTDRAPRAAASQPAPEKKPAPIPHHYVVRDPFTLNIGKGQRKFGRGDVIDDPDHIKAAHAAGHGPKLLRIPASPPDAEPTPVPEKKAE